MPSCDHIPDAPVCFVDRTQRTNHTWISARTNYKAFRCQYYAHEWLSFLMLSISGSLRCKTPHVCLFLLLDSLDEKQAFQQWNLLTTAYVQCLLPCDPYWFHVAGELDCRLTSHSTPQLSRRRYQRDQRKEDTSNSNICLLSCCS